MNTALLNLESHYRFTGQLVDSSKEMLETAKSEGSVNEWRNAIETCLKVQDFAGRELIRYRVRKQLLECADVVNGAYDGQENVELGSWADAYEDTEIPAEAQRLIDLHRGLYQ